MLVTPNPYQVVIEAFTRIVEEKPDLVPEAGMQEIVANLDQELPEQLIKCCNKIWQLIEDSPELKEEFLEMRRKVEEEFQSSSPSGLSRAPGSGKSVNVPNPPDNELKERIRKLKNVIQLRSGHNA